ncbi:tRNA threonylcarbamoyladenosine dehydratase [Methylomarinovum tepidoasis]|uniref:tRNA threonylcarbamoyladenosine dehydratase n=1 Tax=Methylomarinovum tepidoasis TaxID=2840183 RepID=A0AAU9D142_9GAMM|nr:ThiF family adenylyltransferase [Methylomarinovum sp. IN45]BCX88704.1 tRNA threonylcarbamoyladenosine dehydratase [Methylomarinovum sp. IN45]
MTANTTIPPDFDYTVAFSRNLGLVDSEEQERLRKSRVAVLGLGGVGGVDLVTLARMGIGRFSIADPDTFELANFNRQYGAFLSTLERPKAEVMAEIVLDINPEADVRVFREPIGPDNVDAFLKDADVLVDGIDAFVIDVRRMVYRKAREAGIYALGAGPVGFSTVWIVFSPDGIRFDDYFDLHDDMDPVEQFAAYVIGMAPKGLQRRYLDLSHVDARRHRGPSLACACQLAAGVVGAEVTKILLGRGRIYAAPHYHQFDPYVDRYMRRRLLFGNRHPLQRLKRRWLTNFLKRNLNEES